MEDRVLFYRYPVRTRGYAPWAPPSWVCRATGPSSNGWTARKRDARNQA